MKRKKLHPREEVERTRHSIYHTMPQVTVSDRKCVECQGEIKVFIVPDEVWNGLFRPEDWACLWCVGKRLNPNNPPRTLAGINDEIRKQAARFFGKEYARNLVTGARFVQVADIETVKPYLSSDALSYYARTGELKAAHIDPIDEETADARESGYAP